MPDGLCWNCKGAIETHVFNHLVMLKLVEELGLSCNHYPKEKKCYFCANIKTGQHLETRVAEYINSDRPVITLSFCPECGRDLR